MQTGTKFTIEGEFKRRTLLEWFKRKPVTLQQFIIIDEYVNSEVK